jgi:anti-anti-sigma factor
MRSTVAQAEAVAPVQVQLAGELTIYTAAAAKVTLFEALAKKADLAIDLSAVTELDTAGLQLLLMASDLNSQAGCSTTLIAPSSAVIEVVELCNVRPLFQFQPSSSPLEEEPA